MGKYLDQLKMLSQSADRQWVASSSFCNTTVEVEPIALFSTDPSDKTAKTAETSLTEGFVSFGSASGAQNENFSPCTCGTCRHALRDPASHPMLGWRFCGLGWVGGFADHWCCDHWQDAASVSPHNVQVDRAKALMALGWSPSNAIAKVAYGERVQGDRP
jgi:hypothetical protein